jgi:hypothetical protein
MKTWAAEGHAARRRSLGTSMASFFLVTWMAVAAVGCGDNASSSQSPMQGDNGGGEANLQLDGDWLFCDAFGQANPQASSYLPYGGTRLRLSLQAGTLVAQKVDTAGQATTAFITGPLDATTRSWTGDLLWSHDNPDGSPTDRFAMGVQVTFNADGTRFDGSGPSAAESDPDAWFGGRVDGAFTCNAPAGN